MIVREIRKQVHRKSAEVGSIIAAMVADGRLHEEIHGNGKRIYPA